MTPFCCEQPGRVLRSKCVRDRLESGISRIYRDPALMLAPFLTAGKQAISIHPSRLRQRRKEFRRALQERQVARKSGGPSGAVTSQKSATSGMDGLRESCHAGSCSQRQPRQCVTLSSLPAVICAANVGWQLSAIDSQGGDGGGPFLNRALAQLPIVVVVAQSQPYGPGTHC